MVNSFDRLNKREKRDEGWERNFERKCVLRYLYLTHYLIGAFDPERREIHDGTEKRDMQWERTSEGVVRALLGFPYLNQFFRPNRRGRYEQKSEMRVYMPPRYVPKSQTKKIFFFIGPGRSNRGLKVR